MDPLALGPLLRVLQVLDAEGVPYSADGSLASSLYGMPRMTRDADGSAELGPGHAPVLVRALEAELYVDEGAAREAIERRGSFNLTHLQTPEKIDVFVPERGPWTRAQMRRRRLEHPNPDRPELGVCFTGPEDAVMHKLDRYCRGGGVSDRHWGEVLGVLKVQGAAIDRAYLRDWGAGLEPGTG